MLLNEFLKEHRKVQELEAKVARQQTIPRRVKQNNGSRFKLSLRALISRRQKFKR